MATKMSKAQLEELWIKGFKHGRETVLKAVPTLTGDAGADILNQLMPCTLPTCDRECIWRADPIGGQLSRLHKKTWPSGVYLYSMDFAPGDTMPAERPSIWMPEPDDGEAYSIDLSGQIATDLFDACALVAETPDN